MALWGINDQTQQPPMSLLGDDDFEVIDNGQSISPYEMSLLPPLQPPLPPPEQVEKSPTSQPGSQLEPVSEQLLQQLIEAKQRFDGLQSTLSGNNQVLEGLTARLQQSLLSPPQPQSVDSQSVRQELARLRNRHEEWQQTMDDYAKLKSQYGLLINTRERLEEERDELLRRLQQQQQNKQTESEASAPSAASAAAAAAAAAAEEEMKQRICALEASLQDKIDEIASLSVANQTATDELQTLRTTNQEANDEVTQLTQQVKQLSDERDFDRAKLFQQEVDYKDSLIDLRENSSVRQLEQLRQELATRERREQEQQRLYGDSDQAVADIIREAEESKKAAHAEIVRLKEQLSYMEGSLAENARRMEQMAQQEMNQRERADELENRITRQIKDHLEEKHKMQQKQSQLKQAHRRELDAERQINSSKLQEAEKRLKSFAAESDRTVNDILATAESDKQSMQKQIDDLAARLANAEEQLRCRTEDLATSTEAVANLQRHSESLQCKRQALERQLADCQSKCSEATDQAVRFRNQCETHANRIRNLESQLTNLQLEHTQLRTSYNQIEHRLADSMSQEHTWQQKAIEAQATMEEYGRAMGNCQRAFNQEAEEKKALLQERDTLRERVNRMRSALEN